jgi:hypothetical protein
MGRAATVFAIWTNSFVTLKFRSEIERPSGNPTKRGCEIEEGPQTQAHQALIAIADFTTGYYSHENAQRAFVGSIPR